MLHINRLPTESRQEFDSVAKEMSVNENQVPKFPAGEQ